VSGPRTIGQRRGRTRKAQVGAVATTLGLLLVVTFIANYALEPLPAQMGALEFQHVLLLQNQLGRIQSMTLASIAHPDYPFSLGSPVTLGSEAKAPFGHPSAGSLSAIGYPQAVTVSTTQPYPPLWNHGSMCTTLTGSGCGNTQSNVCGSPLTWNESTNNTAFTFTLTGSNDCERVNITGNNNVFTLGVTGSNLGYFILTLFGFNNTVKLTNQFSGSNFHAFFYLYGGNNTYQGVSGPTGGHLFLNTYFIGQSATGGACPSDNLAATDHWSITGSSAGSSIQNLTWYNANGVSTPYHQTNGWPGTGNSGTGNHVGWQNLSGPTPCAFSRTLPFATTWGGIDAHAFNDYSGSADVALDSMAVVTSILGGSSVMWSPPPWAVVQSGGVPTLQLTLVLFVTTPSATVFGYTTAYVETQLVSESVAVISTAGATLAIQTSFPHAWLAYLNGGGAGAAPGTTSCQGPASACSSLSSTTPVTIVAGFSVSSILLTEAVFTVGFD